MTRDIQARGARLVMPSFVVQGYLSLGEIRWSRLISSARVHIERLNERVKRFAWLTSTIPAKSYAICSAKFFVSVFLTRFMGPPTEDGIIIWVLHCFAA